MPQQYKKFQEKFKKLEIEIESLKRYSDFLSQQALESNLEMAKAILQSGKAAISASADLLKAELIIKSFLKKVKRK